MSSLQDLTAPESVQEPEAIDIHNDLKRQASEAFEELEGTEAKRHNKTPAPFGQPLVWSATRQGICEAMTSYRAYEGGCYSKDKISRGWLLTKLAIERDYLDRATLVTYVGGNRRRDANGLLRRDNEQGFSKLAEFAMAAMQRKVPQLIVATGDCPLFKVDLPSHFQVVDWFHITDIWPEFVVEASGGIAKYYKLRFEKITWDEPSWWMPAASAMAAGAPDFSTPEASCVVCKETSKQIYTLGWRCLNEACREFWNFAHDAAANGGLEYSADFINAKHEFKGGVSIQSYVCLLPQLEDGDFGTERKFRAGIVCPKCRGCIRRRDWFNWVYETTGCGFVHDIGMRTYPLSLVNSEMAKELGGIRPRFVFGADYKHGPNISAYGYTLGEYVVRQFLVPDLSGKEIIGSVTVFASSDAINQRENGPNNMWEDMQSVDTGLRRHGARHVGKHLETLTSHFAKNWGAPYKFGVAVLSSGFSEAPDCILKAVQRLRWAGAQAVATTGTSLTNEANKNNSGDDETADQEATDQATVEQEHDAAAVMGDGIGNSHLPDKFVEFNELLALGYFEEGKISFHDDGEDTLGPTVATLSLGSPSVMSFRPKAKFFERKNQKSVLKIYLCHGDMVVMHGTEIHKYYEHKVDPKGLRRFALTCRNIDPEKLPNDEAREDAAIKGTLPAHAAAWVYNGN